MLWAWGACVTRRYDLIGVVNHFGSTGSGHYTAYINHCSRPESDTCEWYCYNDNLVTSLTESQLEDNRDAYILFYQLRTSDHGVSRVCCKQETNRRRTSP